MLGLRSDLETVSHRGASREVPPTVTTAPTVEPITLQQAKKHCKCEDDSEDDSFTAWIQAARESVEFDAEIALCTQTRKQYLDYFPASEIELRCPPVQSITSITYTDNDGATQTLSSSLYESDLRARPGIIIPSYGNYWPTARVKLGSVAVTFVCGYGLAVSVPAVAKQAMLLHIGSAYRNREMTKQEVKSYEWLIDKLRWRRFI